MAVKPMPPALAQKLFGGGLVLWGFRLPGLPPISPPTKDSIDATLRRDLAVKSRGALAPGASA